MEILKMPLSSMHFWTWFQIHCRPHTWHLGDHGEERVTHVVNDASAVGLPVCVLRWHVSTSSLDLQS